MNPNSKHIFVNRKAVSLPQRKRLKLPAFVLGAGGFATLPEFFTRKNSDRRRASTKGRYKSVKDGSAVLQQVRKGPQGVFTSSVYRSQIHQKELPRLFKNRDSESAFLSSSSKKWIVKQGHRGSETKSRTGAVLPTAKARENRLALAGVNTSPSGVAGAQEKLQPIGRANNPNSIVNGLAGKVNMSRNRQLGNLVRRTDSTELHRLLSQDLKVVNRTHVVNSMSKYKSLRRGVGWRVARSGLLNSDYVINQKMKRVETAPRRDESGTYSMFGMYERAYGQRRIPNNNSNTSYPVHLHLNRSLIENYNVKTREVGVRDKAGDFRLAVEEAIIDILNNANALD